VPNYHKRKREKVALKTLWKPLKVCKIDGLLFNLNCCEVFEMEVSRPLDLLNASKDKRVMIELKNGRQFVGKLVAFDIHINCVLEEADEMDGGEIKRKIGKVFLRGDMIILISPA
jgi:small nuclear ribonucleoprotein